MDNYNFRVHYEGTVIFSGFFSVVNSNIVAFYDYSIKVGKRYGSVLLPKTASIYTSSENSFQSITEPFQGQIGGVNIASPRMQQSLGSDSDEFFLSWATSVDGSIRNANIRMFKVDENFSPITTVAAGFEVSLMTQPFLRSMKSLYSNNAQVYYKPHSLATGGSGVSNYRAKRRRT